MVRYRTILIQERAKEIQRVQKILEDTNIKLSSVATDINEVSARAILNSLITGKSNPESLAARKVYKESWSVVWKNWAIKLPW